VNKQILALALPLCLAACAARASSHAPTVPDRLKVPDGNQFALEMSASGVQIYVCQPVKDQPTKYEWAFKAPDARLSDSHGDAGHHFAGPAWESTDGSKVICNLEQKIDAPGVDDIPWLLLSAKANEGQGKFSEVTFIQRIATHGGKAPTAGCDAQHVGQEARIPYTATYCFYVAGS
jgi:hypothetical protein